MKKLFLFAALLMTGFAFYSCEDVVDNPAQDPAQSWNYSVSVKFENFDLSAVPGGLTYKAPTTLYVLNEENTLMGTITTETAPAADSKTYATYAGTLTGSIGNNLILATKIGSDLAKQDGTLESAIENGIVQIAEVPIKIYNANTGNLTTAAANMENTTAIAYTGTNQLNGGDKVSFISDDQSFEWTVNEEFDPTTSTDLYIALPTSTDTEAEYTISTDSKDGITRGATFKLADYPALAKGKASLYIGGIPFIETGIDLTIWDAYQREVNKATGTTLLDQYIGTDQTFIVTQSGTEAVNAKINFWGSKNDDVKLILNNVRLAEDCYFKIYNGAKFDINMIGENKLNTVTMNSPFTWKGTESCKFDELNIGGNANVVGTDLVVNYAAEYTINEDMTLKHLSVYDGGKLTIAEGKKVTVINDEDIAVSVYRATFNLGKGATLQTESKAKDAAVINIENATFNVGEDAVVTAQGGKEGTGLNINNYYYGNYNATSNVNIGKNAKITLIGGPEGILGYGINISNNYNATTNITLDEGATVNATGIDRYGINCNITDWNDSYTNTVTFNIAKNAKITAEDVESGGGFYAYAHHSTLTIDGEGTFEAKSKDGIGMKLHNDYMGVFNFKGGNIAAIGGADKPAIETNISFTIAPEIKSFKATKGADATLYISKNGNEAELSDLVGTAANFNDKTEAGARTITPKPAEK